MKRKQKNTRVVRLKKLFHRHVKLALVPHGANQYRPHLVRRYGLVVVLVAIIGVQAGYNFSTTGSVLGTQAAITSNDLLTGTNAQRARHGLPPLHMDARLSQAAFLKANDMYHQQYWAHVAPDGTTPWHWLGVAGYNYGAAGENLAKDFPTANAALGAWMTSSAHRKNILSAEYTDVGFAVVDGTLGGKPTTLIVALYGEPATAAAGVGTPVATSAPQGMSPATRLEATFSSMPPAAVASLVMLFVTLAVALVAHAYRNKLPKPLREGWYRHHGLLKAAGMFSLLVIIVFLYSGGQI